MTTTIIIIIAIVLIAIFTIIKITARKVVKKAMSEFAKEIDSVENTISAADLGITIEKESMLKTFLNSVRRFFFSHRTGGCL